MGILALQRGEDVKNVVDCDTDEVDVGSPVTVVFDDTGSGPALPRFTLDPAE